MPENPASPNLQKARLWRLVERLPTDSETLDQAEALLLGLVQRQPGKQNPPG